MTFLYPSFLWAMVALSIPILVHLFNFRKTQKVYFSNTRFIQQVQEATSSKRRLKHWLVLASRVLFLFFLVVVFAQPVIPAREQLRAGENIAIYLDNSASMSAPLANGSPAFDAALLVARSVVESFPGDTRFRLLTNDFDPFANSLKTKNQVLDQLAQLTLSGRSRTAAEVQARLTRQGNEREIFWISDFQQSTVGAPLASDTLIRIHLVPLQAANRSNIFIDTVYLDNPFAIGGERNQLTVVLRNDGDEDRNQLTVRLALNGLQAGTATASLPANGSAEVRFEITPNGATTKQAVLTFTDNPISFDNTFYAVLQFAHRVRVVEVQSGRSASPIAKVYGNTSLFEFTSFGKNNVDYSAMRQADLVVLNELPELDEAITSALQQYVVQGGSILVIPAGEVNVASYRFLLPAVAASQQKQAVDLATPDFNNPFFEQVFQERQPRLTLPAVRNTISWGIDRQAILQQADGTPYLSVFHSTGKVYALGSPLQAVYGSFFSNALFVPVMYRIAAFSQRSRQPLYYLLSDPVVTLEGSLAKNATITLRGPQELTPPQRVVNGLVSLDMNGMELQAGHYRVMTGLDTLSQISFNPGKAESHMNTVPEKMLTSFFGEGSDVYLIDDNPTTSMAENIRVNYIGRPLWKYALMLGLLFLLAEILLIRLWKND